MMYILAYVVLNKAHFYCFSSDSTERTKCWKAEETHLQSPSGTIDPDLCPEGTEDKRERDSTSGKMF